VAKPPFIELGDGTRLRILYEDRSVLAIDKPRGWMLVPYSWQRTQRNLQAALVSSIAEGGFWAKSRGIRFLRNVHRLDADTSGILLLARSQGALDTLSELFESRRMEKRYLAVVSGRPAQAEWVCRLKIGPAPGATGRMRVDAKEGKEAETRFRVLETRGDRTLVEASPVTGRTHQIRVHLAAGKTPVLGDPLYGPSAGIGALPGLALRAVGLAYQDPFTRRPVRIEARTVEFLKEFGFAPPPPPAAAPGVAAGPQH
jgi:23S rRNA pseudouridine1911/1915/1917 synthase